MKYHARCQTCAYIRQNKPWYKDLLKTNYFDTDGLESPAQFFERTKPPFPLRAFYRHIQNHQNGTKERIEQMKKMPQNQIINVTVDELLGVEPVKGDHESALDDTIMEFHKMIRARKIPMTLSGGLQAIKIKADIEKGNKDRKMDAFKAIVGASGRTGQPEGQK